MKHRALSMLLALLMVVSLLPIAAVAGNEEANFTMRLQGGTYNASYSLFADTYEGVRFDAYDESKNVTRSLSGNDTLTYDGKVVTSVVYDSNNDSDNTWRVTIAEPESGEQSGWIEYSGKRISIDLRLKHGEKVESFVGKTAMRNWQLRLSGMVKPTTSALATGKTLGLLVRGAANCKMKIAVTVLCSRRRYLH